MPTRVFDTGLSPVIEITADDNVMISGSGQESVEIQVREEETLTAELRENTLRIYAESDLILKVPAAATLQISLVEGSLTIASVTGEVNIQSVGGHLNLQATGAVNCSNIGGHCKFSGTVGPTRIRNIGGNLRGSNASESLAVANVGGNIKLLDVLLIEKVHAGGNIKAKFPAAPQALEAVAGGNVKLWLPSDAGFELEAHSGGEKVVLQQGNDPQRFSTSYYRAVIGTGGPALRLHAGGSVSILNTGWEEDLVAEDFIPAEDSSGGWASSFQSDRIQQRIQAKVAQAEARANAALRRAEARLEAAGRRTDRINFRGFSGGWPSGTPVSPVQPPDPSTSARPKVSDEERMMILNMLAEKKITAEEANQLLDALNGKFSS